MVTTYFVTIGRSVSVQTKVATKQSRFKELLLCRESNHEDIDKAKERYKAAKREARIAVANTKDKAFEDLYKKVDSKEGVNDIYKISKVRERRRRDIGNVRYIKDEGGDAQECSNYKGIKLFSHTMKLWERVIERRLRREMRMSENQFGFIPERSTAEAIHLLRSLIEKYRERQKDLHMAFLDLKKAYDSVSRELVGKNLLDKGTPRRYSRVIKDMYEGAKTRVRTTVGNTEFFSMEVSLHQGSAISPYLFTLILDELSRGIQENIPWCMIFADDIVLIIESTEGLNNRLESWRNALEDNGLRVSKEKTEYLRCDFGRFEVVHQKMDIRIGDLILQPKKSFRYLGLVLHRSGRIDDDVAHPLSNKVEVAELRMMRWTCGKTMIDMIPNGVFRAGLDVDSIIDKMREGRLRWFGHVKRRPQTASVRRVEALVVEGSRRRGRPKLRWEDRLKMDMKELHLSEDMTSDRNAWRDRIRISGYEPFFPLVAFLLVSLCSACALLLCSGSWLAGLFAMFVFVCVAGPLWVPSCIDERRYITDWEDGWVWNGLMQKNNFQSFSNKVSSAELAAQLPKVENPVAPVMLDRICRLLASYSVLTCCWNMVVDSTNKENYLEHLIPTAPVTPPGQQVPPAALAAHAAWVKGQNQIVNELHAMLKLYEETLPKKDANPALHAIRAGRVQKNQKNKSHKAGKGSHGKGKGKMGNASNNASFASKPKTPPPSNKDNPAKDAICHQCGEVGHWRRN
nr:retrovirus-related Pol polyprotein LINE-1 [Tanacetum cinerariifolium]